VTLLQGKQQQKYVFNNNNTNLLLHDACMTARLFICNQFLLS